MEEKKCKDCAHYLQHYAFLSCKLTRIHCGHCVLHRSKSRRPDAAACQHYIQGNSDEEAFVSREFLSKALLQYVLRMELLPPIPDQDRE